MSQSLAAKPKPQRSASTNKQKSWFSWLKNPKFIVINALALVLIILVLFFGQPHSSREPISHKDDLVNTNVQITEINLLMLESFPVQIHAAIKGNVPDPCALADEIKHWREGNSLNYIVAAHKPKDAVCDTTTREVDDVIDIDVKGLSAGTYIVNINGVEDSFTLQVDNFAPIDTFLATPSAQL